MQLNLSRLFGGYNRKRSMFHHDSNVEYCTYIIIMFFFLNTIPIICPNRKSNNNRIHFPREYSHNRVLPLLTSTLMLSRVFARNLPTVVHSCPPARFLSTIPYQHISLKVLIQTE